MSSDVLKKFLKEVACEMFYFPFARKNSLTCGFLRYQIMTTGMRQSRAGIICDKTKTGMLLNMGATGMRRTRTGYK